MNRQLCTGLGLLLMVTSGVLAQEASTESGVTDIPTNPPPTGNTNATSAPTVSTTEGGDWGKCKNGSELFDPPECPPDDPSHPVYFPFPYDCTQYYECTNGLARCIKCANGTIWDQENLVCNHPAAVNCTIYTTTTPLPTTPTTTMRTTEEPTQEPTTEEPTTTSTTTTERTTEVPTTIEDDPINWICPEGYIGLMRHPYDCRLFYNCDPGRRPCLFECQNDLYFNPENGQCDHKFNVPDCIDGTPPPTSTTPAPGREVSINYRNVDRFNFANIVLYVADKYRQALSQDPDPCASMKTYLGVH